MLRNYLVKLKSIPVLLLLIILTLLSIGLLVMYDASGGSIHAANFKKQMIFSGFFFVLMLLVATIDIKILFSFAYPIYILTLLLLISVTIMGRPTMGATRWLNLGIIKMQPSEAMKIALVLVLARYFHFKDFRDMKRLRSLIVPLLLFLLPALIILKQPDLGTAMTLLIITTIMLFIAGMRVWKFAVSFTLLIAACPIAWKYLHDYQKNRILTFFNPERDPLGSGYNIIQSKIAIGSGGFLGKGRLSSTQAQLDFLPEHQTDFIFSLFAEEFGFVGSTILILLFLSLILSGIAIAFKCRHSFGRLLVLGLISVFSVNTFINLGMVTGMLPVVGTPLPFLSYGGSSMATTLISFGIIMNVAINYNAILQNK